MRKNSDGPDMYVYRNCIAALLTIALFGCGGESIDLTPRTVRRRC